MTTATNLAAPPIRLTADEFAQQYGGQYVELIDGLVQEIPVPFQEHGTICWKAAFAFGTHIVANDLGHLTTNDSFVITQSDPDRIREADICFFSYERIAKGPFPKGLGRVSPDLIVEVRSPSQGWDDVFKKVSEYLAVGVRVVVVLDIAIMAAAVYRKDEFQQIFDNGDDLTIPDILPGFSVPVRKLFE
ncbi:MAG TPA: Uma2 family endonuclease [Gemmataceae bacterium]|jgi:Uma2 family endonuclease|nr:Uma2 family endonuclease [Gemmataceae bacterium]